jgi:hypothetical protein
MQALVVSLILLGLTYWLEGRAGHRYAGLFAGLPLTTLITVLVSASRPDVAVLQSVLDGCLIAIAAAAISIRLYAWLHKVSVLACLACASGLFLVIVFALLRVSAMPTISAAGLSALSLGAILITAGLRVNPITNSTSGLAPVTKPSVQGRWVQRCVGVALVLIAFACAQFAPAVVAGLVASAPIFGWSAMASAHQSPAPSQKMKAVAQGYGEGLLIKWGFVAPIAAGLAANQTVIFSLLLGCLGAVVLSVFTAAVHRYQQLGLSKGNQDEMHSSV